MSEIEKTVAFVREQRRHSRNWRHWKKRLAAFGFAIEKTREGTMIIAMPQRAVVCPLPGDLLA